MTLDFDSRPRQKHWCAPKLLNGLKCESKLKTTKEQGVKACSLACSTLGVEGRVGAPDGTRKSDKHQLVTQTCRKPNTRWLVHSWNTFGARTSHGQIRTHKTHHGPDLGEATTFPLIVHYVFLHEAHIQMTFCPKIPKWESRNSLSWDSCDFGAP